MHKFIYMILGNLLKTAMAPRAARSPIAWEALIWSEMSSLFVFMFFFINFAFIYKHCRCICRITMCVCFGFCEKQVLLFIPYTGYQKFFFSGRLFVTHKNNGGGLNIARFLTMHFSSDHPRNKLHREKWADYFRYRRKPIISINLLVGYVYM